MAEASLEATFLSVKPTKNTVRFTEDESPNPVCISLYIQKNALERLGFPTRVKVTIEPVE